MELDIRELERESIREFVQRAADDGYLSGRVLDFGCGLQPYREIVERAGGDYYAYDRTDFMSSVAEQNYSPPWDPDGDGLSDSWDAILCTQSIQYWPNAMEILGRMHTALFRNSGHLVLTGPVNWPEVEIVDLYRYTRTAIKRMLLDSLFSVVRVESRGRFSFGGDDRWCTGWGVIARA